MRRLLLLLVMLCWPMGARAQSGTTTVYYKIGIGPSLTGYEYASMDVHWRFFDCFGVGVQIALSSDPSTWRTSAHYFYKGTLYQVGAQPVPSLTSPAPIQLPVRGTITHNGSIVTQISTVALQGEPMSCASTFSRSFGSVPAGVSREAFLSGFALTNVSDTPKPWVNSAIHEYIERDARDRERAEREREQEAKRAAAAAEAERAKAAAEANREREAATTSSSSNSSAGTSASASDASTSSNTSSYHAAPSAPSPQARASFEYERSQRQSRKQQRVEMANALIGAGLDFIQKVMAEKQRREAEEEYAAWVEENDPERIAQREAAAQAQREQEEREAERRAAAEAAARARREAEAQAQRERISEAWKNARESSRYRGECEATIESATAEVVLGDTLRRSIEFTDCLDQGQPVSYATLRLERDTEVHLEAPTLAWLRTSDGEVITPSSGVIHWPLPAGTHLIRVDGSREDAVSYALSAREHPLTLGTERRDADSDLTRWSEPGPEIALQIGGLWGSSKVDPLPNEPNNRLAPFDLGPNHAFYGVQFGRRVPRGAWGARLHFNFARIDVDHAPTYQTSLAARSLDASLKQTFLRVGMYRAVNVYSRDFQRGFHLATYIEGAAYLQLTRVYGATLENSYGDNLDKLRFFMGSLTLGAGIDVGSSEGLFYGFLVGAAMHGAGEGRMGGRTGMHPGVFFGPETRFTVGFK